MLIANGATSGFERGALKLGPRKAWEMAAIGRLSFGNVAGTAFYLDELPSTDGSNELAGLDIRLDAPAGGYLGATFVNVLNSDRPIRRLRPAGFSAPTVTPGAREGTNTYGETNPFAGALGKLHRRGRLSVERPDRPGGLGRSRNRRIQLRKFGVVAVPHGGFPDLLG